MNFLAHAYLSFRQPEILTGNMVSDFVKGKAKFGYPLPVQEGIVLHRAIDSFTDAHRVNAVARKLFHPAVGKYAGAFLDVVYDYFLANDPIVFPAQSLHSFTQWVYDSLEKNLAVCPPPFREIFPYMKNNDWLGGYREEEKLKRSFQNLVYRAAYLHDVSAAWEAFTEKKPQLEAAYQRFFPELMLFTGDYFKKHLVQKWKL
ncbi:MAG: ACP phosphodiesterase [Flavihumibacter sp.]